MNRSASLPFTFVEPTFGQRLGGAALDGLTAGLAAAVLGHALLDGRGAVGLSLVLVSVYHVVLTATTGQTLGKRWMGTRVVSVETGASPGFPRAALRWLVLASGAIVATLTPAAEPVDLLISVVVLLPVLSRPLHRGLHDRAAGTLVTGLRA